MHSPTIAATSSRRCSCKSATTAATAHGGSGVCAVQSGAYEDRINSCPETSRLQLLRSGRANLRNPHSQVSYVSEGGVNSLGAPHRRTADQGFLLRLDGPVGPQWSSREPKFQQDYGWTLAS